MGKNIKKYGAVPEVSWLPLKKLIIDEEYQRDTASRRSRQNIKKIVDNFSWHKFSPITVSDNGNDTYAIVDGQHRVEAVRSLGDIEEVPCWIIPNINKSEQAVAFVGINRDRVATTPYAIHKSLVVAGDREATMVDDFCNKMGIKINKNSFISRKDPTVTNALSTIKNLLKSNRETDLIFAIEVIRTAYPFKAWQIKADLIRCLADIFKKHKDTIKKEVMVETIRSFDDVEIIASKATQLSKLDASVKRPFCFIKIVLNEYKAKLSGTKKAEVEVKSVQADIYKAKAVNYGRSK